MHATFHLERSNRFAAAGRRVVELALWGAVWGFGESLPAQTPTLDALIAEAEAHWPALAESLALREAAGARVSEAQRAYRPTVSVGGTYSLAAGGRAIALPVGDLLNPVYAALNGITQTDAFPRIDNVEEQFLPNNFYDVRLRVTQPLYRPEIRLSRELASAGAKIRDAGVGVGRADLRAAVRTAYYQVASARTALGVYDAAEALLAEAYRTTASLVRNGAAIPLARERIVAERARVEAERAGARAQLANATAQLNDLLGRALDHPVEVAPADTSVLGTGVAEGLAPRRAELDQLRGAVRVADLELEREGLFRRPRVGLQVDAGSQDFDFGLAPYLLAGLSVEVPLYDGGRHGARWQRLRAERAAATARVETARRGFDLQAATARHRLTAARAALAAYAPALDAAERTYADADRLYRAGETGYLELIDAQQQLTTTRLRRALAAYGVSLRQVELWRALGR